MPNKMLLHNVFNQLLEEITPQKLIMNQCQLEENMLTIGNACYDLKAYNRIYLLGSGKAVIPMTKALTELLGSFVDKCVIVGAYALEEEIKGCEYIQSTHPLPSQKSIIGAKALEQMLESMNKDDLFIYALSGGNSALVEHPQEPIGLDAFEKTTQLMLHSGMPIEQINSVRKHLSRVKGGKLAMLTQAQGVVLVLSDVVGDDLYAIGSAPFYCDKSTFEDAIASLENYDIFTKIPEEVASFLRQGSNKLYSETPKTPFKHIDHHILGSNRLVLQQASTLLKTQGLEATIIEAPLQGDVKEIAQTLSTFGTKHQEKGGIYIFGGEATVVVEVEGKGGRNQHLCLEMITTYDSSYDMTFLSGATDGIDGNSTAAGALVDTHSLAYANAHHIYAKHYLKHFNSNHFFEQTGELLITGATHNNLLDIVIMLITPKGV